MAVRDDDEPEAEKPPGKRSRPPWPSSQHDAVERGPHDGVLEIRFGERHPGPGRVAPGDGGVELRLRDDLLLDEPLRPRCGEVRLGGDRLRVGEGGPVVGVLEPGDHRAAPDPRPLLDVQLRKAADDPGGDVGLHPRDDVAGGGQQLVLVGRRDRQDPGRLDGDRSQARLHPPVEDEAGRQEDEKDEDRDDPAGSSAATRGAIAPVDPEGGKIRFRWLGMGTVIGIRVGGHRGSLWRGRREAAGFSGRGFAIRSPVPGL